jgi:UDP-3-O-[3-hydroxymyristoyl] glucosamine N-acyltransferase
MPRAKNNGVQGDGDLVEKTLHELAAYLGGRVTGDGNARVRGLATLDDAGEGDITFLANPKYAQKVATTGATAVILPPGANGHGRNVVEVANPYLAFAKLLTLFYTRPVQPVGIMPGAHVSAAVKMGADVSVYPGAYIADGVVLGDRVTIHPGVVLYPGVVLGDDVTLHANVSVRERCRIGNRVIVHNGAVIGSDGFGYAPDGSDWYKIPQIGIVVLEDDVEIGANTVIDRAALEVTRIGRGTKIDNLVQVGHNCVLGEHCLLVSQVGVAGSSRLGNYVILGGQAGIAGHLKIGNRVSVAAQAGVMHNIPDGEKWMGSPAQPDRLAKRQMIAIQRLPDLLRRVAELEKRLGVPDEPAPTKAP